MAVWNKLARREGLIQSGLKHLGTFHVPAARDRETTNKRTLAVDYID